MKKVTIYTDGSSPENSKGHGKGGWCAILVEQGHEKLVSGGTPDTTNNQEELRAILNGLRALKFPCEVTIVTDSQFCIGTLSLGWKRKDLKCAVISNRIDTIIKDMGHKVTFEYVRGHTGNPYNEKCDVIARQEAESITL